MMNKVSVLLPMKGHSERIPNKNLKDFAGVPLYHVIMKTLKDCSLVSNIYVDTDSLEIKKDVNENFNNVTIIDRPKNLQGDHVSMNKIIEYDVSQIEDEHFLQTHCTNPLLRTKTLDDALEFYCKNKGEIDSVFSVTELQTRFYWKDGQALNHNPNELIRTQDLTPVYEENSNFYIFSKKSFESAGSQRIGVKPYMYVVNKLEAIDIDEPEDFLMAETLYRNLKTKK